MMVRVAAAIAARGRWVLIAGLIVGLASPLAAGAVRPFVGLLVAALLFLAMLRIGPEGFRLTWPDLNRTLLVTLAAQLLLPMIVLAVLWPLGLLGTPYGLATLLILAAAPITGAAHIAVMSGLPPAPALRLTVIGTALLPLTVLPIFAASAAFGSPAEVAQTVLRLLGIIAIAAAAALGLRAGNIVRATPGTMAVIDALAAVLLGVVVVGLMSAAAETLRQNAVELGIALLFVCALVFALQAVMARLLKGRPAALPAAVTVGNRNVALFLGVLPDQVIDSVLLVIGCYQVPMYLTPLVLPYLMRRLGRLEDNT